MFAPTDGDFVERLSQLGSALLTALDAFEQVRRRLHPPAIPMLRDALQPIHLRLREARAAFAATPPPTGLEALAAQLLQAADAGEQALADFTTSGLPHEEIPRVLRALRGHCRAQALLYPLHKVLPPVSLFFLEPAVR